MGNSPKENRDNLGASLRSEALGRDIEELRPLASQVIGQGIGPLKSREHIAKVATEILEDSERLLWHKRVMVSDLSPSLTGIISIVRAVYERNVRRDILHELIPYVLGSVNVILEQEDIVVKEVKGEMKGRTSARTMVKVRSLSGKSKKSKGAPKKAQGKSKQEKSSQKKSV